MRFLISALLCWIAVSLSLAQKAPPMPVGEFVRNQFYHGIPYRAAHAYGPQAVFELVEILGNEKLKGQWANAIWVLGMIGDSSATQPLIDFLEKRFTGEVDRPAFNALLQVNQALGFLVRDPQSKALDYLKEGSSPQVWSRRVSWKFGSVSERERDLLLTQLAINGLGITGSQAALAQLERLRDEPSKDQYLIQDNIREGLKLARRIMERGYEEVFSGDYIDEEGDRPGEKIREVEGSQE